MELNNQVEDENENDSLFEGMVLFDPSEYPIQILPTPEDQDSDHPGPDISNQPHPLNSTADKVTTTASNSASSTVTMPTSSSHLSEPLDEDLFSDLTLVTTSSMHKGQAKHQTQFQLDQNSLQITDPSQVATIMNTPGSAVGEATERDRGVVSISRQISRRKRRPGLRIGYGRDAHTPNPSPDLNSPNSNNHTHDDDDNDQDPDALSKIQPSASPPQTLSSHSSSVDKMESPNFVSQEDVIMGSPNQQDANRLEKNSVETEVCNSPEFKLEQVRIQISENLTSARNSVASVSASRKDVIQRRRKIMDNLNISLDKYSNLERQLEEACEAEDFETAERLSESLASAEGEKQAFLNELKDVEALCDAMDSRMHEVLDFLIATEEKCDSLLQTFATDAANDVVLGLNTAEAESAKELEKWHLSNEVLEAKKMETEIESLIIQESCMVLNNSVELLVEDDKREKNVLCQRKAVLTDELEKLLALVEEKKREIEENDSLIGAVERRISVAVSGFQHLHSNMDAKYDSLQSTLSQLQLESQSLSVKRREIDEFLNLEKDKGEQLKKIAQLSIEDAEAYREVARLRKFLMSNILKIREDKASLSQSEDKLSKDVQMLQQEFHSASSSLQELSSRKSHIQQDIVSSKQRISFIDKRVPELEAEKKVAAAGRNFKEAARVAAEAKSLSNEKDSICVDIDRALLDLEKLEEKTRETMKWLQETEVSIQSKEKEVAKARFQRLLLIAGAAAAEGAAALESGDTGEANLLLAEAEAARCEAKKLQPIYNFHEDELSTIPKHFISAELVFNLGREKLADLVASICHPEN